MFFSVFLAGIPQKVDNIQIVIHNQPALTIFEII